MAHHLRTSLYCTFFSSLCNLFFSVPIGKEVIVGDGRSVERNASSACQRCGVHRRRAVYVTPTTTTASPIPPDVTAPLAYIPSLMSTTAAPAIVPQVEAAPPVEELLVRARRAENAEPLMPFPTPGAAPPPSTSSTPSTDVEADLATTTSVTVACATDSNENCTLPVYDGTLDMNSNYTGFLEVVGKLSLIESQGPAGVHFQTLMMTRFQ